MATCGNCGHPDTLHRLNAAKKFGCESSYSGTTTSGIIGEPYTIHCSCADYTETVVKCRACGEVVYPASERTRPRNERWEVARAQVRGADEPIHLQCAESAKIQAEIEKSIDPRWLAEFRKKRKPKS